MAEVYAAVHRGDARFERPVCIKRILPDMKWDAAFKELFFKEISIAGRLRHSNLVQVYDCIEDGHEIGLVMELVDGLDLSRLNRLLRRRGNPLEPEHVAYVAGQALLGLNSAHRSGIVHRDISPQNVLVSRNGEVKIVDYGLAKALTTLATLNDAVMGKPAYMSPEQATGEKADARTDLYSLGLVLYELMMGRPFFRVKNQAAAFRVIAKAERPRLPPFARALSSLIEGLLEPERERRLQSAVEAISALPSWSSCGPRGAQALRAVVREFVGAPIDEKLGLADRHQSRAEDLAVTVRERLDVLRARS